MKHTNRTHHITKQPNNSRKLGNSRIIYHSKSIDTHYDHNPCNDKCFQMWHKRLGFDRLEKLHLDTFSQVNYQQ